MSLKNSCLITCLFFFNLNFFIFADHWQRPQSIDEATWNIVLPYLLPFNHPLKAQIDNIFFTTRATATPQTMQAAGFEPFEDWKWDKVYVAKHPSLKGYLIKAYLDNHLFMNDHLLIMRLLGAENIRSAIKAFGYQKYLRVPNKWLYPLPDSPLPPPGLQQKFFILIVEEMDLVSPEKNKKMFYHSIKNKQLDALVHLIHILGLSDSVYLKNIPFCKDHKIAFVDTERTNLWPIPFEKLTQDLNQKNAQRVYQVIASP